MKNKTTSNKTVRKTIKLIYLLINQMNISMIISTFTMAIQIMKAKTMSIRTILSKKIT